MKILAINYSQSGQLDEILENFIRPLKPYAQIDRIHLKMKKAFPFPWTAKAFFNTMPESVLEEAKEIEIINYKYDKYDLIIFGYQPWYLSPSIPASSLLQNQTFKDKLKDTKVITVIGARNMWLNAQESVKRQLQNAGAKLIANIPLIDKHKNSVSAISILYWMLTGKKDRFLNIFPKPGIAQKDIDFIEQYGDILKNKIKVNQFDTLQKEFLTLKKVKISTSIMFVELRAKKLFLFWAKFIKNKVKTRPFWVQVYKYYLLVALFLVAPVVILLLNILIFPFTKKYFEKKKDYFCSTILK